MTANIVIIGGTGLIGNLISHYLQERNPSFTIYLGSRRASDKKNIIHLNIDDYKSLRVLDNYDIDLLVICTKDSQNNALKYAIQNNIDYIDVTKPTPELQKALAVAKPLQINSKIVFASGWMGGIVPLLIPNKENNIDYIKIAIYYSINDKAGNSSADFLAENADKSFSYYKQNNPITTKHFLDVEKYSFAFDSKKRSIFNVDIPDLYILNTVENIPNVQAKLTFNINFISKVLHAFQKINLFKLLNFKTKKMLFGGSGNGDIASFEIQYMTKNKAGQKVAIVSEQGQSELTAFSTVLHIEQMLFKQHAPMVYFVQQLYTTEDFSALLTSNPTIKITK